MFAIYQGSFPPLGSCGSDIEPQVQGETAWRTQPAKADHRTQSGKNPEKMLAEKHELEKYLSGKLNRQVEVIIPTDSATVVESFRNGT